MESTDQEASAALMALIDGETSIDDGVPQHRDALIKVLWDARYSSIGHGSGGDGGNGFLINVAALGLYETIDGFARSCLREWGRDYTGRIGETLSAMFEAIRTQSATWMHPTDVARMYGKFPQWVRQIEDLIDPPREKQLMGECPKCGEASADDESTTPALVASFKPGRPVTAQCLSCDATWEGIDHVKALGLAIGAEVDFVALREIESEATQHRKDVLT